MDYNLIAYNNKFTQQQHQSINKDRTNTSKNSIDSKNGIISNKFF